MEGIGIEVKTVKLVTIAERPGNRSSGMDKGAIAQLAESMKTRGLLQRLVVRPRALATADRHATWEIVCGARRLAAAKLLGWDEVTVDVRTLTDDEADQARTVENLQRENLHPLEEADAYRVLLAGRVISPDQKSPRPRTTADVAVLVGKSEATIRQRLQLLQLTPKARKAFESGQIGAGAALVIARLAHPASQDQVLATALRDGTTDASGAERLSREAIQRVMLDLARAPFDPKDATLPGGSCLVCPKRTGNAPMLFPDVERDQLCTDAGCYTQKVKTNAKTKLDAARAAGKAVFPEVEGRALFDADHGGGCALTWKAAQKWVCLDDKQDRYASASPTWRVLLVAASARPKGDGAKKVLEGARLAVDPAGRLRSLALKAAVEHALRRPRGKAKTTATSAQDAKAEAKRKAATRQAALEQEARDQVRKPIFAAILAGVRKANPVRLLAAAIQAAFCEEALYLDAGSQRIRAALGRAKTPLDVSMALIPRGLEEAWHSASHYEEAAEAFDELANLAKVDWRATLKAKLDELMEVDAAAPADQRVGKKGRKGKRS